jgi:hypothetical protein
MPLPSNFKNNDGVLLQKTISSRIRTHWEELRFDWFGSIDKAIGAYSLNPTCLLSDLDFAALAKPDPPRPGRSVADLARTLPGTPELLSYRLINILPGLSDQEMPPTGIFRGWERRLTGSPCRRFV